jgi:hypothetical protein
VLQQPTLLPAQLRNARHSESQIIRLRMVCQQNSSSFLCFFAPMPTGTAQRRGLTRQNVDALDPESHCYLGKLAKKLTGNRYWRVDPAPEEQLSARRVPVPRCTGCGVAMIQAGENRFGFRARFVRVRVRRSGAPKLPQRDSSQLPVDIACGWSGQTNGNAWSRR